MILYRDTVTYQYRKRTSEMYIIIMLGILFIPHKTDTSR